MMVRELPDYHNPPAVETALGVRFSPIEGWNVFHYGLLLSKFKDEYPKQELHPPLGRLRFSYRRERPSQTSLFAAGSLTVMTHS